MSISQRNTSGLKEHAQQKRAQAFERTEQAIKNLLRENRSINFENVAETAGVSRAWLYKQPAIKERIEQLRGQQAEKKTLPPTQRASDASKTAMVQTLRQQIKNLQAENSGLRQQIEFAYGRTIYAEQEAEKFRKEAELLRADPVNIYNLRQETNKLRAENRGLRDQIETLHERLHNLQAVEQEVEVLRAENVEMKRQLEEYRHCYTVTQNPLTPVAEPKVVSLDRKKTKQSDISDRVKSELAGLKITINSTLAKTIKSASEELVLSAIEALKETMANGDVERPGGWLNKAIKEG